MTKEQLVEWFLTWRKPVRQWLRNRRAVPPSEVDDLTQEVFLRLLRYADRIVIEHPQSYIFKIAANVSNEWRERSRVAKPHNDEWLYDILIDEEHQPEEIKIHEQTVERVQIAIGNLSARQQATVLLKMDDLKCEEIAVERKVSLRVVSRDLTKAYNMLRMQLDRP